MDTEPHHRGSAAVDIFSGGGVGALLGLVVGMSTSPVVAVVVGALSSLLGVLLGLDAGAGNAAQTGLARVRLHGLRIASFGIAAVAGVFIGLYVRINNPLAESPKSQLARWDAAFPDNPGLARQMMLFERNRLVPATLKVDGDFSTAVAAASGAATNTAVLFGSAQGRALCRDLDSSAYGGDAGKLLLAWGDFGKPMGELVKTVNALPAEQRLAALESAHALLCGLEKENMLR